MDATPAEMARLQRIVLIYPLQLKVHWVHQSVPLSLINLPLGREGSLGDVESYSTLLGPKGHEHKNRILSDNFFSI